MRILKQNIHSNAQFFEIPFRRQSLQSWFLPFSLKVFAVKGIRPVAGIESLLLILLLPPSDFFGVDFLPHLAPVP